MKKKQNYKTNKYTTKEIELNKISFVNVHMSL